MRQAVVSVLGIMAEIIAALSVQTDLKQWQALVDAEKDARTESDSE